MEDHCETGGGMGVDGPARLAPSPLACEVLLAGSRSSSCHGPHNAWTLPEVLHVLAHVRTVDRTDSLPVNPLRERVVTC